MSNSLDDFRNKHDDFEKGNLKDFNFDSPIIAFNHWFNDAVVNREKEANAFVLSTSDAKGKPSSRMLYLKEMAEDSFVFYTNYNSKKGQDLTVNPFGAMLFYWIGMERQIRIEGKVSVLDSKESDAYFASRPRESQLGAWASYQSEILVNSGDIADRLTMLNEKYSGEIPRPPHWGGYVLIPTRMEFWQGRPSRLHDRYVFEKKSDIWNQFRINP